VTQPSEQVRSEYERAGRAVHTVVREGFSPLLAAAAAGEPFGAVAFQLSNAVQANLRALEADVRRDYDEARAAWARQRWSEARNRMVLAARAVARMTRALFDASADAGRALQTAVGRATWETLVMLADLPAQAANAVTSAFRGLGMLLVGGVALYALASSSNQGRGR
jgi:hypothetical protein